MGPDVLNEMTDFEHVMAPFEIEEGQPLLEAAQIAGEDVGMWEALVGAVKGGAPVMGFNPGLSTKGITKHDEYMQQRLEDYRYRQRHEIRWWQDKGVWIYIAGYWYLGHTVDFEGSYLTKVPIEKRWTTEVRVEYHFYDQGQLVKQQTRWLDPNSGSPPLKSFQDTKGQWNPLPLEVGYWKPGTDPYAVWQQEASDLLAGAYYRKPGTLKWQYLRKEPLSFASRPGQVTLNYGANKFAVEARDTVMECAWRVREEQGTADVPTTDLWALETAIQEERDRRFQEEQQNEQADALQEWEYLRDECARLADLTYGNPPLHERLDFMSWGSSVEDVDAMTLLVQEAEDWLESQQPKDDPFDPSLIFEPLDSDAFDTTKDHGEKLAELHDKAREAQEWVPQGGDLYWELMDATTLGWGERERIKSAIRRAKAYRQTVREEQRPKETNTIQYAAPPQETHTDMVCRFNALPAEAQYTQIAGKHRRLMMQGAQADDSNGPATISDWFMMITQDAQRQAINRKKVQEDEWAENYLIQYAVGLSAFLDKFNYNMRENQFGVGSRFHKKKLKNQDWMLEQYKTDRSIGASEKKLLRWKRWLDSKPQRLVQYIESAKQLTGGALKYIFNLGYFGKSPFRGEIVKNEMASSYGRTNGQWITPTSKSMRRDENNVDMVVPESLYNDIRKNMLEELRDEESPDSIVQQTLLWNLTFYSSFVYEMMGPGHEWILKQFKEDHPDVEADAYRGYYGTAEDVRMLPKNVLKDVNDARRFLRKYKSDAPEFLRVALTDAQGNRLPAMQPYSEQQKPYALHTRDHNRIDTTVDRTSMFLVPEHICTRTQFSYEMCARNRAFFVNWLDTCKWILDAYGDIPSADLIVAERIRALRWWKGKRQDDYGFANLDHLHQTMRKMKAEVRVAERWLRKMDGLPEEEEVKPPPPVPSVPPPMPVAPPVESAGLAGYNVDIPPEVSTSQFPLGNKNSARAVRGKEVDDEEWTVFESGVAAARFAGIDPSTVSQVLMNGKPRAGWIFERMDGTVRQKSTHDRRLTRIEARRTGTEEWTVFETQKAAALAADFDISLVSKIIAGTTTKKYDWEFRREGEELQPLLPSMKGSTLSVMMRLVGQDDYTWYESLSAARRATGITEYKIKNVCRGAKTYPTEFDAYYSEQTTDLLGLPEKGGNLVQADPPVNPDIQKKQKVPVTPVPKPKKKPVVPVLKPKPPQPPPITASSDDDSVSSDEPIGKSYQIPVEEDGPPEEKASEPTPTPPEPEPAPQPTGDTRPVTDGDTDWRGSGQGFQTLPVKQEPQPESQGPTLPMFEGSLPGVVKPEEGDTRQGPYNGTSGMIDLTRLWEDLDKREEPDLLADLQEDDEKAPPRPSVVDPVPRRSERIRTQPQPMTYREATDVERERLEMLKNQITLDILQYIPKRIKVGQRDFDVELKYLGKKDAYLTPTNFYAGRFRQNFLLPAEIWAEERDDEEILDKLQLLEDMVDYFSEDVQEDVQVGFGDFTSVKSNFWQQVAVALMIKHSIRLICEGAGFPSLLWKNGNAAFAGYDMAKVSEKMESVVDGLQSRFGDGWPRHFIPIPKFLPTHFQVQLNHMAANTLGEVQDAAVQIHDLLVANDWVNSRADYIVLDPPEDAVEDEPIVCERPQSGIPALEDEQGQQIRTSLRDLIDKQITVRVEVNVPPPQPPVPGGSGSTKEKGHDFKWLFGIALTLWLSYQMD